MKPTRRISPPGTYFVTSCTWQRRSLFQSERIARLFLQTLNKYRRGGKFQLHAFVLMPDHFHLLLTPAQEVPLERALQLIKGGFSHASKAELRCNLEIWERGFTDHRIRDTQDFAHHRDYIHQNPVAAAIVVIASEYRYSSAYPGFKLDAWPSAAKADLALGV